jgi:hypothetical protein
MSTENIEQVFSKAKEIAALIEPLGDLEQHAALEMADIIRAYRPDFSDADPCEQKASCSQVSV